MTSVRSIKRIHRMLFPVFFRKDPCSWPSPAVLSWDGPPASTNDDFPAVFPSQWSDGCPQGKKQDKTKQNCAFWRAWTDRNSRSLYICNVNLKAFEIPEICLKVAHEPAGFKRGSWGFFNSGSLRSSIPLVMIVFPGGKRRVTLGEAEVREYRVQVRN